MKRYFQESSLLIFSVTKWIILSSIIGVIVGISTGLFLRLLEVGIKFTSQFSHYYLLIPVGMIISTLMVKYLAPDAKGHGTEKVIEAIHKRSGKMNLAIVPVKALATVITIATGGSAGREGPAAQIGAGLASFFANLIKLDDEDRKKIVICGLGAGFSAVIGTPVAGAIFGVEVLFSGRLLYDNLLHSLVAGMIAFKTAEAMGVTYFSSRLHFVPELSHLTFLKVMIFGIIMGIISLLFIEIIEMGETIHKKLKLSEPVTALLGGAVLIGLIYLIPGPPFYGMGMDIVKSTLEGNHIVWYAFIMKAVFTSITIGFGGSGGVLIPIFFVGASAGSVMGGVFGESSAVFAALGMIALLAGAANTPIAASIIAIELFGDQLAPFACLVAVIAYLIAGHRSVFPSQILAVKKSSSVDIGLGKEMRDTKFIGGSSKTLKNIRGRRRFREKI